MRIPWSQSPFSQCHSSSSLPIRRDPNPIDISKKFKGQIKLFVIQHQKQYVQYKEIRHLYHLHTNWDWFLHSILFLTIWINRTSYIWFILHSTVEWVIPNGFILQPTIDCTWTPVPLCDGDISLTSLAIKHFDARSSAMINWCRMYLKIISIYDLLIYNSTDIHPEYLSGTLPLSRSSKITWPLFPRLPKAYWSLWTQFIRL